IHEPPSMRSQMCWYGDMDLTDAQWPVVEPLLPKPRPRADGKGRPRSDDRRILNGILWILRTGAPWKDLPERYAPRATCHRRFQESGVETARSGEFGRRSSKTSIGAVASIGKRCSSTEASRWRKKGAA